MWMPEEQLEIYVFIFLGLFSSSCSFKVRQKSLNIPKSSLKPPKHVFPRDGELTRIELGLA